MTSPDHLWIDRHVDGTATVVHVVGDVDLASAHTLSKHLSEAATTVTAPGPVVVDLTDVEFFCSRGMTVLITAHQQCQQQGIPLRVVAGPALTRRLALIGLQNLLSIIPTLTDALTGNSDTTTDPSTPAT